jgi:hypothetical protein
MAETFDFGKCAACGDNNSKSVQQCRSCAAALPWAKPAKNSSGSSGSGMGLGDIAFGGMAVALLGGLIFLAGIFLFLGNFLGFFPTFTGAGYITIMIGGAIWRVGSNME